MVSCSFTTHSILISPWAGVTCGIVCLSALPRLNLAPAREGRTSVAQSSVSTGMFERQNQCLPVSAHSWSVFHQNSGICSELCPCSPGAGISKILQGHGMLDGSSSWPPHTEAWHCAEGSFSKSIFVDTTFWLKQWPDQKWVFHSCCFFFRWVIFCFLRQFSTVW